MGCPGIDNIILNLSSSSPESKLRLPVRNTKEYLLLLAALTRLYYITERHQPPPL